MNGSESIGHRVDAAKRVEASRPAAKLNDTGLRGAALSWAIMNHASLRWASFFNPWTIPDQLAKAGSHDDAAMPDDESSWGNPAAGAQDTGVSRDGDDDADDDTGVAVRVNGVAVRVTP
jgi:hypothetical protein